MGVHADVDGDCENQNRGVTCNLGRAAVGFCFGNGPDDGRALTNPCKHIGLAKGSTFFLCLCWCGGGLGGVSVR